MLKLIILSTVFVATTYSAAESRYKDYVFNPDYTRVETEFSKPEWLSQYVFDWYEFKPFSYLKMGNSEFVLFGANVPENAVNNLMKLRDDEGKGLRINYFDSGADAFVIKDGKNTRIEYGPAFQTELVSTGHRGQDYFGCIESKPIFEASMIEGRKNSVWVITGRGDSFHYDGVNEHIKVSVYDSETTQKHFDYFAMFASYMNKSWQDFDFVLGATRDKSSPLFNSEFRGKKIFAKSYISDFDRDNKLDVIIWHRQYYSTLVSDKERKGFILEKEWFSYYQESENNFVEQQLSVEAGHGLLETAGLTWKDGFPKDNSLCKEGYLSTIPMMPRVIDPGLAY